MRIKSISIDNIKSFRELEEIRFRDELNILIGPNGGGKSNLLDVVTIVLNHYFLNKYRETSNDSIRVENSFSNISQELENYIGNEGAGSEISVTLSISPQDISNMDAIADHEQDLQQKIDEYDTVHAEARQIVDRIDNWSIDSISAQDELEYVISNYDMQQLNNQLQTYNDYLKMLDLAIILSEDITSLDLQPVYFYFSPYRGGTEESRTTTLQSDNHYQLLHDYLSSTSREQTSAIELAKFKLADQMRNHERDQYESPNNSVRGFWEEREVETITQYMDKIGYDWDMVPVNRRTNEYEIIIEKDGRQYDMDQLSSGEKEIVNFLFGVLAVDIQNGIIVIDEPELHLHPRWQTVLLELFEDLQDVTNNQLIFTTHSPSFISESSVESVMRVNKDQTGSSQTTRIDQSQLSDVDDLIHMVHSSNNEKMFFADYVLLVEGKSDMIIFRSLVEHYLEVQNKQETIEVLEVNGKYELKKYSSLLDNLGVRHGIVADRDYVADIGGSRMQNLFTQDENNIRDNLSIRERAQLERFVGRKRTNNTYILRDGDLEDHLPYSNKDLRDALELTRDENLLRWISVPDKKTSVLIDIAQEVIN